MFEIDLKSDSLVVVSAKQRYEVPLKTIYSAGARLHEVAVVTAHKAPELLALFNEAYLDAGEAVVRLKGLLLEAEKTANRRRSVVILDEVPRILKEKGLSSAKSPGGSEDIRKAILDADDEYLELLDQVGAIKAAIELMTEKKKGFENAYTSVKKILGDNKPQYGGSGLNQNRNLSAGYTPDSAEPGMTVQRRHPGFGHAG